MNVKAKRCMNAPDRVGQSKQRREQHGRNDRGVSEETLRSFSPLPEENTLSMKEPVKASSLLPIHVLFQNRPALSDGSDARALVSPAAFYKDVFHVGMEILWRHVGLFMPSSHCVAGGGKRRRFGVYLVGFTGELAATKLALDLALGAIVLQVVRQVAARQLDGAAVGARYYIEGAGGEVALKGDTTTERH